MKIVVDIPEEYYNLLKGFDDEACSMDMLLLKNGKPLPKGHGRLIDADDLLRYIDTMPSWLTENGWRMIRRIRLTEYIQDSLPTIIEADEEVDNADSN